MAERVRFINDADYLVSFRDAGLELDMGIYELLDNAIDAGADMINIILQKTREGKLVVAVNDNGAGIPRFFDEDGIPHDEDGPGRFEGIPYVLSLGGRHDHQNELSRDETSRIGINGFGLSMTAICLTRATEVWTRSNPDEPWRYGWYDLEQLINEDCNLRLEETRDHLAFGIDRGTFVVLKDMDRIDAKYIKAIRTRLLKDLSRIYRKHIAKGVRIRITLSEPKPKKDDAYFIRSDAEDVLLRDPLLSMEGSAEVEKFGTEHTHAYDDVVITFDEKSVEQNNGLGPFYSSVTGEPARLTVRFRRIDAMHVRETLGLPLSGAIGSVKYRGKKQNPINKWGFNHNEQGFSVLRNGREITHGWTHDQLYSKHSDYTFFRGEISFDDGLDDICSVEYVKSRWEATADLLEILNQRCKETLVKIGADHRGHVQNIKRILAIKPRQTPVAEAIAKRADPVLTPRPRLTSEDADREEELRADLEKQIGLEIRMAAHPEIERLQDEIESAENEFRGEDALALKAQLEAHVDSLTKSLDANQERFSQSVPCRLFEEPRPGDPVLYNVRDAIKEAHVMLNTDSDFHTRVYSLLNSEPDLQVMVDLLLFAMARSEFLDNRHSTRGDDWKQIWESIRLEVSDQAAIFVGGMPDIGGDE